MAGRAHVAALCSDAALALHAAAERRHQWKRGVITGNRAVTASLERWLSAKDDHTKADVAARMSGVRVYYLHGRVDPALIPRWVPAAMPPCSAPPTVS